MFDGVPLTVTARENGVPERTARRWLAAYRADGLRGLARPQRRDADSRRMPTPVLALVEGLAPRRGVPRMAGSRRLPPIWRLTFGMLSRMSYPVTDVCGWRPRTE